MSTFTRLLKLIAPFKRWVALAVLLNFVTIGSSVGLMAMSAYLISKAALVTDVSELSLAITSVRLFAILRAVFRYLERYFSHTATFRILTHLRVWFYSAIEPLAPARLMRLSQRRSAGAQRGRHRNAGELLHPRGGAAAGRRGRGDPGLPDSGLVRWDTGAGLVDLPVVDGRRAAADDALAGQDLGGPLDRHAGRTQRHAGRRDSGPGRSAGVRSGAGTSRQSAALECRTRIACRNSRRCCAA